jgi:hypothetical protein
MPLHGPKFRSTLWRREPSETDADALNGPNVPNQNVKEKNKCNLQSLRS